MKCTEDANDDDDKALSEEQRFYYLRLMATPGGEKEPIKTKFLRWAPPSLMQDNIEQNRVLESQAMRVVRTIGQAFEVCHKVAQEQVQEKAPEDNESNNNLKTKGSIISDDDVPRLNDIDEKLAKVDEASSSEPPEPSSPSFPPAYIHKRQTSVQSRSTISENPRQIPGADTATVLSATNEPSKEPEPLPQQSTSAEEVKKKPIQVQSSQQTVNTFTPGGFVSLGSPTMPHSNAWAPLTIPPFQSVQSLDKQSVQPTNPFYPMPLIGPSTSYPYALSTALMIPPYATLPFPHQRVSEQSQQQQMSPPLDKLQEKVYDGNDMSALQLNMSLDQYNQQLIRSQLDQAKQTAQVASCQVQLLRDQLTTETTARIEAQTRTHQLLNANRELLEQVQALVGRLQLLESKIAADIQNSEKANANGRGTLSTNAPSSTATQELLSCPKESSQQQGKPDDVSFFLQNRLNSNYIPNSMTTDSLKLYQLKTLADLRAGSLPPKPDETDDEKRRKRDDGDKGGAKTEPESATEDVSDSSSDQGEKPGESGTYSSNVAFPMYQNILLSNPQVMPLFSPYFPSTIQNTQIPSPTHLYHSQSDKRELSPRRMKSDKNNDISEPGSSTSFRKQQPKLFDDDFEFKRMSFNENLRKLEKKKASPKSNNSSLSKVSEESQSLMDIPILPKKLKEIRPRRSLEKAEAPMKNMFLPKPSPSTPSLLHVQSLTVPSSSTNRESKTNYTSLLPYNWEQRRSGITDKNVERVLASSTLATAMYPPKPYNSIRRPEVLKRRTIRALSMDMKLPPLSPDRPSVSTDISHDSNPELRSRSFKGRLERVDSVEKRDSVIFVTPQPKILVDTADQKSRPSSANTVLERTQSYYMDSQKLSDPAVLAKLTQRLPVQTTGEMSTKTSFLPSQGSC